MLATSQENTQSASGHCLVHFSESSKLFRFHARPLPRHHVAMSSPNTPQHTIPPLGESWPLPSADEIGLDLDGVSAWRFLLSAECAALALPKPAAKYQDKVIAIRLVAWLVKDFYEHNRSTAYKDLIRQIVSCNDVSMRLGQVEDLERRHEKVFQLGLDRNQLFRVFCSRTDPTPSPSPHTFHLSYENHRADIFESMAVVGSTEGRTHTQAKADALLQDGYKCVFTGLYDKVTLMNIPHLNKKSGDEGVDSVKTQVAHLFSGTAQSDPKYAASAMAILDSFGLHSLENKLQSITSSTL
ncbi:hypothetical protein K438DRAFT_1774392 [Mycena galopus ATCC 62051]|nr:hypothetical protein K438DRAFT_1774392 [Mycena galopus ATCC 62051]